MENYIHSATKTTIMDQNAQDPRRPATQFQEPQPPPRSPQQIQQHQQLPAKLKCPPKPLMRKQNAISVLVTSDSLELSQPNEIQLQANNEIIRDTAPTLQPAVHSRRRSPSPELSGGGGGGGGKCNDNGGKHQVTPSCCPSLSTTAQAPTTLVNAVGAKPTVPPMNISRAWPPPTGDHHRRLSKLNMRETTQNIHNLHHQHHATTTTPTLAANTGSVTNLNNLAVNSQHSVPRNSLIGRLERSSFQAQRLSDVGVAFGQQITAKMGLKLPASQERIVEQTRWLYLRYVFVKLRQNSLPLRDLNLTKSSRARRAAALGETPELICSAPLSAPTVSDQTSPFSGGFGRKRTAMSQNLNSRDLSLLAARIKAINQQIINEDSADVGVTASGESASSGPSSSINQPGASSNRKYLMDPSINNQIFTVIINIIKELRGLKPEFYGDTIYELIGIDKFSSVESLLDVQMTICQEMTRSEISWCRIAALFSLFGAMSLDCVRLGAPEHVGPILDNFIEFVERDLALWISQQGGWEAFLYKYRAGFRWGNLTFRLITIALPLLIWILISTFH